MNRVIPRSSPDVLGQMGPKPYNFEDILPLDLVRQHAKVDDVPSVTDALLMIYRKAAFHAAQEYTGLMVAERKFITERVEAPAPRQREHMGMQRSAWFNHTTKYAMADSFVFYYGLKASSPERVPVIPNSRSIRLPNYFMDFGIGCCNPCSENEGARVSYCAGFSDESDIPSPILLGVLKYIAHSIENVGDNVVVTTANSVSADRPFGTNDPAVASGAVEIWRAAIPDII